MRIEPAASDAACHTPIPSAAATAEPPLLPPEVMRGFQGFRVTPCLGLSLRAFHANSGVAVLPTKTAPASRRRVTQAVSSIQGSPGLMVFDPRYVGQPLVSLL